MAEIPLIGCLIPETFLTTLLQSNLSVVIARSGMTHRRVGWGQSYFWWFYYQMWFTHWFPLIAKYWFKDWPKIWVTNKLKKTVLWTAGWKIGSITFNKSLCGCHSARKLWWLWYLMCREQRCCLFVFCSIGAVWVFLFVFWDLTSDNQSQRCSCLKFCYPHKRTFSCSPQKIRKH